MRDRRKSLGVPSNLIWVLGDFDKIFRIDDFVVELRVTQFKERRSRRSVAHQRGDIEESRRASHDESGSRRSHPLSGLGAMAQSMAIDVSRGAIIRRPRSSSGQSEPLTAKRKGGRPHPAALEDASGSGQGEAVIGSGVLNPVLRSENFDWRRKF